MTRDLSPPLVQEADFIEQQGSEYCSSVFVIIQKYEIKNFEEKIKTLSTYAIYPTDPSTGNIKWVVRNSGRLSVLQISQFLISNL